MMERRDVVGSGLLGLTAVFATGSESAAALQTDSREVAREIDELRQTLDSRLDPSFSELREIRQQQRTFLKASQKFPDFIELGVDVWDRLYDWAGRHQVTPNIVRRDDGRYTMGFMFTTLVLRPELMDNYVGFGYDVR